ELARLAHVVGLFLQDAGVAGEDRRVAAGAFLETCRTGRAARKPLGSENRWVLDTLANPGLGQVVVAVGFRPTALVPGAAEGG
ncbi:MAG: hypothetical protein VKQ33_06920, partial [Candidatus Sericytochromatia bacterium]|nr:hypothetical protein [Candidatus Sericytochromatia bacterium]